MKPHVICLMASSVGGRTLHSRWRPKVGTKATRPLNESDLEVGYILGRVGYGSKTGALTLLCVPKTLSVLMTNGIT